jgi:hypothetical protein
MPRSCVSHVGAKQNCKQKWFWMIICTYFVAVWLVLGCIILYMERSDTSKSDTAAAIDQQLLQSEPFLTYVREKRAKKGDDGTATLTPQQWKAELRVYKQCAQRRAKTVMMKKLRAAIAQSELVATIDSSPASPPTARNSPFSSASDVRTTSVKKRSLPSGGNTPDRKRQAVVCTTPNSGSKKRPVDVAGGSNTRSLFGMKPSNLAAPAAPALPPPEAAGEKVNVVDLYCRHVVSRKALIFQLHDTLYAMSEMDESGNIPYQTYWIVRHISNDILCTCDHAKNALTQCVHCPALRWAMHRRLTSPTSDHVASPALSSTPSSSPSSSLSSSCEQSYIIPPISSWQVSAGSTDFVAVLVKNPSRAVTLMFAVFSILGNIADCGVIVRYHRNTDMVCCVFHQLSNKKQHQSHLWCPHVHAVLKYFEAHETELAQYQLPSTTRQMRAMENFVLGGAVSDQPRPIASWAANTDQEKSNSAPDQQTLIRQRKILWPEPPTPPPHSPTTPPPPSPTIPPPAVASVNTPVAGGRPRTILRPENMWSTCPNGCDAGVKTFSVDACVYGKPRCNEVVVEMQLCGSSACAAMNKYDGKGEAIFNLDNAYLFTHQLFNDFICQMNLSGTSISDFIICVDRTYQEYGCARSLFDQEKFTSALFQYIHMQVYKCQFTCPCNTPPLFSPPLYSSHLSSP